MTISSADLGPVEKRYAPGAVVTENQFVSSDVSIPFGGNVTFEIDSLTGRDIKDLSIYGDSESEVLFAPGTSFRVVERTVQDEKLHIKLQEIKK